MAVESLVQTVCVLFSIVVDEDDEAATTSPIAFVIEEPYDL